MKIKPIIIISLIILLTISIVNANVCPSVCKEMWLFNKGQCMYIACGSGCGPDYITTFRTLNDCMRCRADVNHDGIVDIVDLSAVAGSFGSSCGQIGFNERNDLNGDCKTDIFDLIIVAINFGTICRR